MDKLFISKSFLTSLFLISSLTVFSQNTEADTLILSKAIAKAKEIYKNSIGSESRLYNGVQYNAVALHNYDIGYPYFLSDDWTEGCTVNYEGQQYENVSLLYDVVHDKIVVDHAYSHFSVQLISEKVKSFSMASHTFVLLQADSAQSLTIPTGFYDLLYDGKVKVYSKRRKDVNSIIETPLVKTEFVDRSQFFVYKNGNYFAVKNRSSILKVFSDRKSSLRKYISKNKLNFHKDRDFALAESARFYDESEKQP